MNSRKTFPAILSLIVIATIQLTACKNETIIETVEVPIEVQVEVEKPIEVEVLITPTPEPIPHGGFVIQATSSQPSTLNPILGGSSFESIIKPFLFLKFLRIDPFTGEIVGQIAENWTASEDGLTYTFKLRRDIFWTDGTPVTAKDVKFTFDAILSDLEGVRQIDLIDLIESITIIDDYTLEIIFLTSNCSGLVDLIVGILPSHMYADDFSDLLDSPLNENPTITNGPLKLQEWVKEDHITLVRNEEFYLGAPNIDGLTYRFIGDLTTEIAIFLAGESDLHFVRDENVSVIEGQIALGRPFKIQKYFEQGYYFAALNLSDPENPEYGWIDANENNAFDDNEIPNLLQEPHPILSDRLVRQAIAYAVDYTSIINKVAYGNGVPMAANVLPGIEWAYNWDLEPYTYNTEKAASLLDEAGWRREGEDGIRMKNGKPLSLHIMTNPWIIFQDMAVMMKDNLENLGFEITVDILDFGTVVGKALAQEFDIFIGKWGGMGPAPDDSIFWSYRYDIPGGGFNFVSYYNKAVENLLFEANTIPGCSTEKRGDMYKRIQELIHEDAPYVFFYNPLFHNAWNARIVGVNPNTWDRYYNIHEWYLETETP